MFRVRDALDCTLAPESFADDDPNQDDRGAVCVSDGNLAGLVTVGSRDAIRRPPHLSECVDMVNRPIAEWQPTSTWVRGITRSQDTGSPPTFLAEIPHADDLPWVGRSVL